jgi:hypothetical protein
MGTRGGQCIQKTVDIFPLSKSKAVPYTFWTEDYFNISIIRIILLFLRYVITCYCDIMLTSQNIVYLQILYFILEFDHYSISTSVPLYCENIFSNY